MEESTLGRCCTALMSITAVVYRGLYRIQPHHRTASTPPALGFSVLQVSSTVNGRAQLDERLTYNVASPSGANTRRGLYRAAPGHHQRQARTPSVLLSLWFTILVA